MSHNTMRLTCLVDNATGHGSTLWGEHGLSFLIQSAGGNVLWDTGQSGTVLLHNLNALGLTSIPLHAVALSHAHDDHIGGLDALLALYPGLDVHAHRQILAPRYSRRQGEQNEIGLAAEQRERAATDWRLGDTPRQIAPGIYTTGSIHPRPYPQGGSPYHMVCRHSVLQTDDYADDLSLVLRVGEGIVLLCGCCHAGLRNTLATVRAQYDAPLLAVVGGTHLVQADSAELGAIIAALQAEGAPALYLNHCTGERALYTLRQALGERVHSCPAGTVISFP